MKTHLKLLGTLLVLISFSQLIFAQDNNCACCTEDHGNFDFWVGEWEVFLPDGSVAGYNTVNKIQGQCALEENWTSAKGGFTGSSYNFYNKVSGQWEQLWIDNGGNQLKLFGNRNGNQMVLSSEPFKGQDGVLLVNRITWTANEDGTVRQHWEILKENEVVQVAFDGLYKKKDPSKN